MATVDTVDRSAKKLGIDSIELAPLGASEKLAYLACYSSYIISLQSEDAQPFAAELSKTLEGVSPLCCLDASELPESSTERNHLLATRFNLRVPADAIVTLRGFVREQDLRPVVMILSCELLADEILYDLCSLTQKIGAGLVLFSETGLALKKASLQLSGQILHTTVGRLESHDVKRMLRTRSVEDIQLSDAGVQRLVEESDGKVHRVEPMLEELVTADAKPIGLPMMHMSVLVVLAIVIVGGTIAFSTDDSERVQASIPVVSKPEERSRSQLQAVSSTNNSQETVSSKPVSSRAAELDGALSNGGSLLAEDSLLAEGSLPADGSLLAEGSLPAEGSSQPQTPAELKPILLASEDPNAWVNDLPAPAAGVEKNAAGLEAPVADTKKNAAGLKAPAAGFRENAALKSHSADKQDAEVLSPLALSQAQWIESAKDSEYTLQIVGSHDEIRIKQFMREHQNLTDFGYFETTHRGQAWYVLTYGRFANRAVALEALEELTPPLSDLKPWARGVSSIR